MVVLTPTNHSPVVALLLALFLPFLPGIATVYNRQYSKAAAFLAIQLGSTCLCWQLAISFGMAASKSVPESAPNAAVTPTGVDGLAYFVVFLSFVPPILYLAYIVDAFMIARKLSDGRPVRQWECF
jgi:TM2 domain-containing membrane protein YozV